MHDALMVAFLPPSRASFRGFTKTRGECQDAIGQEVQLFKAEFAYALEEEGMYCEDGEKLLKADAPEECYQQVVGNSHLCKSDFFHWYSKDGECLCCSYRFDKAAE